MRTLTKHALINEAKNQLAKDLACLPEQFDLKENIIMSPELRDGRRRFSDELDFFRMATFGKGAVITADSRIMDWCREYLLSHEGIRLFEHYIMIEIENQIRKFGMTLFGVSEFYLPNPGFNRQVGLLKGTEIRWYEKPEIPELYSDRRFRNALLYDINGLRPDMLAVAAVADGEIKAMAGASMDSGMFWQIGIDVMPDYRNKGLGAYLVSALTDAILERGFIPYYGTWSANIASRNVAASSGYFPAWVETHAMIRDKKVTGGV